MNQYSEIVGVRDVARLLGKSKTSVKRMVEAGAIPVVGKLPGKLGAYVFDRAAIEEMAAASC